VYQRDPRTDGDPFRCRQPYDRIHELQPQCLVSDKQGCLGTEDFFAPEHKAYNRFDQPFTEVPRDVCTTMIDEPRSRGWYAGEDVRYKNGVLPQNLWADKRGSAPDPGPRAPAAPGRVGAAQQKASLIFG